MKFQVLQDFKSREFEGTQYVEGMVYAIRPASEEKLAKAGHTTLAGMVAKWAKAQLFVPSEDLSFLGVDFKAGVTSYCLDDEFATIVEGLVDAGKAEYIDGALVSFNITEASSGITGA